MMMERGLVLLVWTIACACATLVPRVITDINLHMLVGMEAVERAASPRRSSIPLLPPSIHRSKWQGEGRKR